MVSRKDRQAARSGMQEGHLRFYRLMPIWVVVLVSMLLLTSAVLNVIALLPGVPFLEIKSFLLSSLSGPYSILHVVQLLWEHHLYPLVVLVVGFSIIFPPVKLILGTMALTKPMTLAGRERLLSVLGHLGRWSLLDVFVSLLIVLVLSREDVVGVSVHYGLYCFLGAIVLSMSAGAIMHEQARRIVPDVHMPVDHVRPLIVFAGWQGVVAAILSVVALVCIARAVGQPMFQVDQFGMASNIWSLRDGIDYLFKEELRIFAMAMFLFLVIAPVAVLISILVALFFPQPHRWRRRLYLVSRYISEWCMLDVFALAMVLYLSEQTNFVPLRVDSGMWFLFGSVIAFSVATLWAEQVMFQVIRRREEEAIHKAQSQSGHASSE